MERRVSTRAAVEKRRSWNYLPKEIQIMILKFVAPEDAIRYYRSHFHSQDVGTEQLAKHLSAKRRAWEGSLKRTTNPRHASVSKQWQYFFERISFEHLFLHQEDVLEFERIIERQPHRKAYVRWIWLRLELADYSCEKCQEAESADEIRANNALFTKAVYELFHTLSAWNPAECRREGITLELSAHSPSDADHFGRELNFRIADNYFHAFRPMEATSNMRIMLNSPSHSWTRGRQSLARRPPAERDGILARLFGDSDGLRFDLRVGAARMKIPGKSQRYTHNELPEVPALKALLIRRQFYRLFSVGRGLGPIIEAMPNMETFRYESWASPMTAQGTRELQNDILIHYILSRKKSLRAFSMYENTSPVFHGDPRMHNPTTLMSLNRYPAVKLGEAFARRLQNLEIIHGARNMEGEGFFRLFWPYDPAEETPTSTISTPAQLDSLPTWANLIHLSLTSTRLNRIDINWFLMAAGSAAQRMPALKLMELWNYDPSSRCVFRYMSKQGRGQSQSPEMEIQISWWPQGVTTQTIPPLKVVSKKTYECWQEVARRHCNDRVDLAVEVEYMNQQDWNGSVIQHLYLSKSILTDVSYDEMENLEEWDVPT